MHRHLSALARAVVVAIVAALTFSCASSAPTAVLEQTRRYDEIVDLPIANLSGSISLEQALLQRRSERDYTSEELPLATLGQLFWAGQGVTGDAGHRTAPSAGALYPLELYAVTATTFSHYLPAEHRVEQRSDASTMIRLTDAAFDQEFVASAPVVLVITGVQVRTEAKYGAAAGDLMNREAGHAAQNVLLQASALDLAAVPVGGFDPASVARLLALGQGEEVLYLIPVGYPANRSADVTQRSDDQARPDASVSAAPPTSESSTTSTRPPEPRSLTIDVHPPEATAKLHTANGFSAEGQGPAPITFEIPAEVVDVTVSAVGYQEYRSEIVLDGDPGATTEVTVWLDRPGQLVHKLFEVEVGGAPKGVAFTPDGSEVWTTLLNGSGVEVIDVSSGQVVANIDLDHGAVEVIFDRSGDTAYVSQMQTNSVFEIDVASRTVKRQFNTKGAWTKVIALSPDETTLYASNWVDDNVSQIDLASGDVMRLFSTVRTPRGLYPTPDGDRLYVTGFASGELEVIDLVSGDSEVLQRTGGSMRHLVGSPDGTVVYASDMTRDTIFAVDTETDEVTVLATTDRKPNTIDLSPDGRVLFVSNRGRNNPTSYYLPGPEWGSVLLIDTETGEVLDAVIGGNQTTGLEVSDDGTLLAFSDLLDDRVVVYSVPSTEELLDGGGGRYEDHLTELAK